MLEISKELSMEWVLKSFARYNTTAVLLLFCGIWGYRIRKFIQC